MWPLTHPLGLEDCRVSLAWLKFYKLSAFLSQPFIVLKMYFVKIDVIFFARRYCMIPSEAWILKIKCEDKKSYKKKNN